MTNSYARDCAENIASLCGLGRKTKFPGTLGSVASLFFSFASFYFFDTSIHILFFLTFLFLGLWAVRKIYERAEQKDYQWIVIDEWIGMWFVSFFLFEAHVSLIANIGIAIGGFIIFRIIDILKFIPPIPTIDTQNIQTPVSVILDDIIAGCYSYVILMLAFGFYNIHTVYSAFLILLTPMIANMTPVFLRKIEKFKKPINEKILGQNKTWRGFLGGIFVGTLCYYLLTKIHLMTGEQSTYYIIFVGFLLSFGALTGDLVKSYFKRRAHIQSGEGWSPWDQIDYILGAILMTCLIYDYTLGNIVLMLIVGGTASALAHNSAYAMNMINTRW